MIKTELDFLSRFFCWDIEIYVVRAAYVDQHHRVRASKSWSFGELEEAKQFRRKLETEYFSVWPITQLTDTNGKVIE